MTKFILHGGETGVPNKHNKAFYQEWVKDFTVDFIPTILLVYFSRPEEDWDRLEGQDRERFAKYNDRSANFIVVDSDINVFKEQIKEADVIYVRGGSSDKLMDAVAGIKGELKGLLDGKVYAGSSAGVMMISDFSRSNGTGWKRGFGIIPINAVVHFSEELRESLQNFKKDNPDNTNECVLIPETEFVVKTY